MTEVVAFELLRAEQAQRSINDVALVAPTDVSIRPGRGVVLRGPNGSGKSTMLQMMTGATFPSAGSVTLDGAPVDERSRRVREVVAALLWPVTGYRELTVQDHLVLVDQTWGGPRETCAERVHAMFEMLDIEPLRHRFLHELSSGQRQLVDLAMTLIRPSGILVLDEPEQRLDNDRRAQLARILLQRKETGVALLVACHDESIIEVIADDTVTLSPVAL